MIGKTNSSKRKINNEKLNIILNTNQLSHEDIDGVIFYITYDNETTKYVWEGEEICIEIPINLNYIVSFSDVEGYRTPDSMSFTSISGNKRSITAMYLTEKAVISVGSSEGTISGFEVKLSKKNLLGTQNEYTRLEYIESTGTQYIDTEFKPNQDTRVILSAYNLSSSSGWTFGTWESASTNQYAFSCLSTYSFRYGTTNVQLTTVPVGELRVDFNKNNYSLNETSGSLSSQTFSCPYSIYLCAINAAGSVSSGKFTGRIYSCKIYDNGTLVRDYTPAINSSGIAGLYDAINNTFVSSKSSEEFIAGESKNEITQTSSTGTYKIPFRTFYEISANDISGFVTPTTKTFTASIESRYIEMMYTPIPVIDLSMQDIHGNSIQQTTANCYVIKEMGKYKFPLVFGNALKNGSVNSAAYTKIGSYCHKFVDYNNTTISSPYIENVSGAAKSAQLSITDTDGVFTNIEIVDGINCKYIQFEVISIPITGANGIISVKNSSGVIMWSWHIWIWPYDLTPVEITNATGVKYNILPVNLATKLDTVNSGGIASQTTGWKNWFYQWGRPIPLLCSSAYNSTNNHESFGELSFSTSTPATGLNIGIQNPTILYYYDGASNNCWFSNNSSEVYNLWDASNNGTTGNSDNNVVKTIYDPCPIGFKVPNGNTFSYFSTTNKVGNFTNGWKFKRYSGDTVGTFFPATGHRNAVVGTFWGQGSDGYIWMASSYSYNSSYYFCWGYNYCSYQSTFSRSGALSIRPVQE